VSKIKNGFLQGASKKEIIEGSTPSGTAKINGM